MRSFFEVNQNYFFLLTVFSLVVLFIFYKNKFAALAVFILLAFVFGGWITDKKISETKNLKYVGKNLNENAIVQKVSQSSFGQNLIVELQDEKISVLVNAPQYPEYAYGDLLEISCIAKAIENLPTGQAGKDSSFDYRSYMAKEGVLYQCEKSKIKKIGEDHGSLMYAKIISIRSAFEEKISKVIPAPYSALASGLLFGGSSGLSKDIQNDFSRTGMTHIVAVSGYNVTIIVEYLMALGIFLGLWRKQAIWFAFVGIILFVIMSGLPSSAVRAGVMSGVLLWAMKNGRLASSENAVIFAGSLMLLLNPLLLRWDIGFQLSFLATIGIVASASFWEDSFVKKNKAMGISEIIALSLSAQVFVLPIIAYNFKIVSLISLLANIFILPIIPLSMLLVFLVSIFGFLFPALSLVLSWFVFVLLFYEIQLIHILAGFSWASLTLNKISPWFVFMYYLVLVFAVVFLKRKQNLKIKMENDN